MRQSGKKELTLTCEDRYDKQVEQRLMSGNDRVEK